MLRRPLRSRSRARRRWRSLGAPGRARVALRAEAVRSAARRAARDQPERLVAAAARPGACGPRAAQWARSAGQRRDLRADQLADSDRQGTLDRLARMEREVLSRRSLAELMAEPALDLYAEDRKRMPLEDVVENMRKALRIKLLGGPNWRAATSEISCMYPDKFKAQSVIRELVAKFVEQTNATQRYQAPPTEVPLQLLDRANLPKRPIYPNRLVMVAVGLVCGAVLGLLALLVRRSAARFSKSA